MKINSVNFQNKPSNNNRFEKKAKPAFGDSSSGDTFSRQHNTGTKIVLGSIGAVTGGLLGGGAADVFSRAGAKAALDLEYAQLKEGQTRREFITSAAEAVKKPPARYVALATGALLTAIGTLKLLGSKDND